MAESTASHNGAGRLRGIEESVATHPTALMLELVPGPACLKCRAHLLR